MKKIIILGSAGMAGHMIYQYLSKTRKYTVVGVARSQSIFTDKLLDCSDFNQLDRYLSDEKPNIIINCIGILVQQSNDDICNAIEMNSYLPHFLSKLGNKYNFKLIHISTDCVFSGKSGNYKEDSFCDGDTPYARTKALGEVVNNRDLTIRTSIIGPELKSNGTGLLDWFLKQSDTVSGYSNVFWSGVTTLELAKVIEVILDQEVTGLYHICSKDKISKYELLNLINEIWEKKVLIESNSNYISDKSMICTRTDVNYTISDYSKMLQELHDQMLSSNLYTYREQ